MADKDFSDAALSRIAMLSDNFENYSSWKGGGPLPDTDRDTLSAIVTKAHQLNKRVRFWAIPDFMEAWKEMMKLNVDYINTDHTTVFTDFLWHQSDSARLMPYNRITLYYAKGDARYPSR